LVFSDANLAKEENLIAGPFSSCTT
jgi:hypothetical protein